MTDTPAARPIDKSVPGVPPSGIDEIIRQFVFRRGELKILLEIVRSNIDSPSCQHTLVIGPHGQGKTTLLARLGAELQKDDSLSKHLFPVRVPEENRQFSTLADFWLAALFHLAQATAAFNSELSRELRVTHADLSGPRGGRSDGHSRTAFLNTVDQMDRKIVLMVENLQAVYTNADNLDRSGWQLRHTLQTEPGIILVDTATRRFAELDDPKKPFFDFFGILELRPLVSLSTDS